MYNNLKRLEDYLFLTQKLLNSLRIEGKDHEKWS